MLISNLLTHSCAKRRQKTFILQKSLPVTFYFKEEFHMFWGCIRYTTNNTKTISKALQVLDFYLISVNKLRSCPTRSLILEANGHQMLPTLRSARPLYCSARKREESRRVWMLLQAQQKSPA